MLARNQVRLELRRSTGPVAATWRVVDSSVAAIDSDQVLRAIRQGSTTLFGRVGDRSISATINVGLEADTSVSLIAHRGFAGLSPENTLIAFNRAFDLGADAVEMDVILTKDSIPVIMHDGTVDRTTNGTGAVAALTLEQIRQLDDCARTTWSPCQVPTLEEALALVRERHGRVLVDLKGQYSQQTIRIVVNAVARAGLRRRVMFTSFGLDHLRWIRQLDRVVSVGLLSSSRIEPSVVAEIAPAALLYSAAFLDTASALDVHVAQAKSLGVDVGMWTVYPQILPVAERAVAKGVLRVITDVPLDRSMGRP